MSGNSLIKLSDKPLLIEAFIITNSLRPSTVKCSPLLIIVIANLNNSKSEYF